MKNRFYIIILPVTLSLSYLFSGCVDENLVPNSGNVNVHIYDNTGFPSGSVVNGVSIGPSPMYLPNYKGEIELKTTTFPYSLRIFEKYYTGQVENLENYIIFDEISRNENFISVPYSNNKTYENKISIEIDYPIIPPDRKGLLKFISKDIFHVYGSILEPNSSSIIYNVFLPGNENQISGKFLFFCVGIDSSYQYEKINNFYNFGEKSINLSTGYDRPLIFSEDDTKYHPGKEKIQYSVFSYNNSYTQLYLSFDDYGTSSDISLGYGFDLYDYAYIPATLPINFSTKIYNSYLVDTNSNWYMDQFKWQLYKNSGYLILDNSQQLFLDNPSDNAQNICDSTIIDFSSNQCGVYFVQFQNKDKLQTFVTSKNKISIGELKSNGFIFKPQYTYRWWIEKPSGMNSLDDFLSAPYVLNPNYTSNLCSQYRVFTLSP